ncbi:Fic family protein [Rhodococcus sp. SORGH_AS_0303]|uniref:Fic family protein n=1 Tax=Rhodococcus sp. SORGH_AS_0303 TaxID=3041753 RepID=UPI0027D7C214|nr:Fic family protein [Rhodococcus sp. SORGH_AS_0303]
MSDILDGTPYLLTDDAAVLGDFDKLLGRADAARSLAGKAAAKIEAEAQLIFAQFRDEIRADLVSESNKIEGYLWSTASVAQTVQHYREILERPVRDFMDALRGDARVYEALGLYRAYQIADEWANERRRPRQSEIRELHQLIIGHENHAGRYKLYPNEIGGSDHKPLEPFVVPQAMQELSDWWSTGTGNTVLDATVVHAWITHIHPFEDGNGRMARILANLTLVQDGYPPFLLRSESDRNQYYKALALSDNGELLPLFDMFIKVLRRTSKQMCRDGYARKKIQGTLLNDHRMRYQQWSGLVEKFFTELTTNLQLDGIKVTYQGVPAIDSFVELQELDSSGNSWAAIFDTKATSCLLWFGFPSDNLRSTLQLDRVELRYPSLFLSPKSMEPHSAHPFRPRIDANDGFLNELYFEPLTTHPVLIRTHHDVVDYSTSEGVINAATAIRVALFGV